MGRFLAETCNLKRHWTVTRHTAANCSLLHRRFYAVVVLLRRQWTPIYLFERWWRPIGTGWSPDSKHGPSSRIGCRLKFTSNLCTGTANFVSIFFQYSPTILLFCFRFEKNFITPKLSLWVIIHHARVSCIVNCFIRKRYEHCTGVLFFRKVVVIARQKQHIHNLFEVVSEQISESFLVTGA